MLYLRLREPPRPLHQGAVSWSIERDKPPASAFRFALAHYQGALEEVDLLPL